MNNWKFQVLRFMVCGASATILLAFLPPLSMWQIIGLAVHNAIFGAAYDTKTEVLFKVDK